MLLLLHPPYLLKAARAVELQLEPSSYLPHLAPPLSLPHSSPPLLQLLFHPTSTPSSAPPVSFVRHFLLIMGTDSQFVIPVTKTIELVDGLENAINCRNKNDLFFHLKELEKLSLASIDNSGDPAEVSRRLLGILGLESIQSVDPRLKRLLASIAHRFMQKLYVLQTKGNAQQQLLRSTLEQWRDTLSAFSSLASDEDNGWRYEVECMQSLVQMMTRDTNETKEEDTLFFASRILQVLNCTFINPDPAQVLGLLQEIAVRAGQVAVDRGQQAWYSKVVASNSLALLVVSLDPQTTPNYVQTVSSVIQEVEKSLQKALDRPLAASWKTIYTDLCTLQYILLNISNSALQEACISGIPGSNCPGIQTFTRFSRFRIAHNWRVREKTAEILLLALDEQRVSSQNQELIRQILAVMGLSETDKRVKLTLSNAGSVQELAATLKKSWEKSKTDLEL